MTKKQPCWVVFVFEFYKGAEIFLSTFAHRLSERLWTSFLKKKYFRNQNARSHFFFLDSLSKTFCTYIYEIVCRFGGNFSKILTTYFRTLVSKFTSWIRKAKSHSSIFDVVIGVISQPKWKKNSNEAEGIFESVFSYWRKGNHIIHTPSCEK